MQEHPSLAPGYKSSWESDTCSPASPLEQQHVTPGTAAHPAQAFTAAYDAETMLLVKGEAGPVVGKDPCLQRPETLSFRFGDESRHESISDSQPLGVPSHVDADFSHAGVHGSPGER